MFSASVMLAVALGRLSLGAGQALAGRYCAFSLPFAIAVYAMAVDLARVVSSRLPAALLGGLVGAFLLSIPWTFQAGLTDILVVHERKQDAIELLLTHEQQTDEALMAVFPRPQRLRPLLRDLEQRRYNVYAGHDASD